MDVGPFVIHIRDAVVGAIILHARPRQLASPPSRLAAAKALARFRLAEDPPVVFRADAVVVETAGRRAVRRQFREARPKARIDIPFEHLGRGVDVSVGIKDAKAVLHPGSSSF
jgi:hypothetical protein